MREILFRGKKIDNGRWVYGHYYAKEDKNFIIAIETYKEYEVIPETVGQYTELKDKNGEKIFEGDIVQFRRIKEYGFSVAGGYYDSNKEEVFKGIIYYENGGFEIKDYNCYLFNPYLCNWRQNNKRVMGLFIHEERIGGWNNGEYINFEVIGNKWDNPELLEEIND